jgi:hypothetical protein
MSATFDAVTAGAALPQALRRYVTTSAICASDKCQPNDGMAGAVGAASVATTCAPVIITRIVVPGSLCRTDGAPAKAGKRFATPIPLRAWQAEQLST